MTEEKALARRDSFSELQRQAKALFASGYFTDAKSEAQAIVKVMAGSELGLPAFASMTGIHIIQGKPTLGSNVIATLVKNDPRYDFKIKQCDNTVCVLGWYENGEDVGESSFTYDEAKTAGLTGKDNWKKYTSDMLFARAISRGARRFAPGIFGGSVVYTPDEMGVDTDEEGFIEVKVVDLPEEEVEEEPVFTPNDIYALVVEAGLSENTFSAKNALNYCKTGYNTPEKAIEWMQAYRASREQGFAPNEAGDQANEIREDK